MLTPDVALTFFVASLLLGVAPGPDIIFVLTQSAVHGVNAGIATTFGLLTGLCAHTAAVAMGVAALIQRSALAFTVLKTAGALYLLYLAWLSFRAGYLAVRAQGGSFPGYAVLYRRGIVMNITNPKISLFFLAFLPQFCDPSRGGVALQVMSLGALFMLSTLFVFFIASFLGGRLAVWFNASPRGQVLMHRAAGVVFAGLALALFF
ncbi:MAG: LysE family translocator [Desulfovibrio sp.]|jgi:threonine/homoserine/homoserine lactone efflux protein|nr:LysE family translocator [Desulfovibrio sp.]